MFSPMLAAPNEHVLCAPTDRAAPYLFFYFFHIPQHIITEVLFEVKVKERHLRLYDPAKEVIKRFEK
jgi:hypothetical protein